MNLKVAFSALKPREKPLSMAAHIAISGLYRWQVATTGTYLVNSIQY